MAMKDIVRCDVIGLRLDVLNKPKSYFELLNTHLRESFNS